MAKIYKTKALDEIDQIAFDHYGFTDGAVEALLKENDNVKEGKSLAELAPILEEGLLLTLPDLKRPTETTKIMRLYD